MSITSLPRQSRFAAFSALDRSQRISLGVLALIHLAALVTLFTTEFELFHLTLATLSWIGLNLFFLAILGRPLMSALLSLVFIAGLIAVSLFKFEVTWMTVTFLDVLIVDSGTVRFPAQDLPQFPARCYRRIDRRDPARDPDLAQGSVPRTARPCGARRNTGPRADRRDVAESPGTGLGAVPGQQSRFELRARGLLVDVAAFDARLDGRRCCAAGKTEKHRRRRAARRQTKPPHIIMVLDESSFDITTAPGIKVPAGYKVTSGRSTARCARFMVEGTGGPTWYTEYNVLTGLSARSFGRLLFYVTRIAAERVERGLPQTLRRCGYKTFSLYPAPGCVPDGARVPAFGRHRAHDRFERDARGRCRARSFLLRPGAAPDGTRARQQPLFMFVYTVANHFPWDTRYRPDLTPGWRILATACEVGRIYAPAEDECARLCGFRRAAEAQIPQGAIPDRALRRSSAVYCPEDDRTGKDHRRGEPQHGRSRSALFRDLLRDRRRQLQAGRPVVGARQARRALSAAGGAGSGGPAARSILHRAEGDHAALRRHVLSIARTAPRRGASIGC